MSQGQYYPAPAQVPDYSARTSVTDAVSRPITAVGSVAERAGVPFAMFLVFMGVFCGAGYLFFSWMKPIVEEGASTGVKTVRELSTTMKELKDTQVEQKQILKNHGRVLNRLDAHLFGQTRDPITVQTEEQ